MRASHSSSSIGIAADCAAVEGLGQHRVDPLADRAAVALARQEHERGDEAVELVEAQEDAHLRPFAEIEDAERGRQQLVLGNLEQLVAREGVQHMRQRLAVVTGRAAAPIA